MSSKKKKILSALLASSMLVSQVSVVAFAAEAVNPTADMLDFTLSDVTYDGTAKKLTTVSVKTEEEYSDKISVILSDVKYSTTEQDNGEYPETTVDEPIDAGTYYVYVKVTSNDTGAYNTDYVVKLGSFTIAKAEISEIAINDIAAPSGGTALATSATSANTALSLSTIEWKPTASDGNAAYNQAYTASITVSLKDSANYKFADSVSATIGESAATSCTKEGDNYKVTKDFAATAKKQISSVSVNGLTAPKAGGTPTVFKDLSSGSEDYTVEFISWYSFDEEDKKETFTGDAFEANTKYNVVIMLAPTPNCAFGESVTASEFDSASVGEDGKVTLTKTYENSGSFTNSYTTEPAKVENLTYTGEAQALVTAGEAKGGTVMYSLTSGDNYSTEIPTKTNAGTHTVYYKVVGGDNYEDITEKSVEVTIAAATPTDNTAKTQNIITGSGEFEVPSFTGVDGNALAGNVTYSYGGKSTVEGIKELLKNLSKGDTGSIEYTFTPTDNTNYESVNGTINFTVSDILFKVGDAAATLENAVTIKENPTYGDTWADIIKIKPITAYINETTTTTEGFSIKQTGKPNAGDSQSFDIVFNGELGGKQYVDEVVVSGNVNVAKKTLTVSAGTFAVTKSYDKTNSAGQKVDDTALSVTGILEGDDVTVTTTIGAFSDSKVGSYNDVTVTLGLSGEKAANYTLGETTVTVPGTITAQKLESIYIADIADQTYTGKIIIPDVTVKTAQDGDELVAGTDYEIMVQQASNVNVGQGTITIKAKDGGNYDFTATPVKFNIVPVELTVSAGTFKVVKEYDGTKAAGAQAKDTNFSVMGFVNNEVAPINVTIPEFENAKVGKGNITVTISLPENCKNYTLKSTSVEVPYEITGKNIDKTISVSGIDASVEYTGSAIEPVVTVKDGETELVKDTDYTVEYKDNTNAGTATVTITAKDGSNYTFTKIEKTFTIKPLAITPEITVAEGGTYDGTAKTPAVTVKYGEDKTVDAANYVVAYSNNINAGKDTGKVTITAKSGGNYTFKETTADFTIAKASAPTVADTNAYYGVSETGDKTVALVLPNVGTIDYEKSTVAISEGDNANGVITETVSISASGITFTLGENAENSGKTATITATIVSQNYDNITAKLVVTINEKETPAKPTCILSFSESGGTYTATITSVEGAEYSFDGTSWGETNTKSGIAPNTVVTAYIRIKANETANASPVASVTATTPALKAAMPAITAASTTFTDKLEVEIVAEEGAEIFYTTDGTVPSASNGTKYTGAFTITATTTVKAIAIKSGYENSDVETATYTKKSTTPSNPGGSGGSGGGSSSGGSSSTTTPSIDGKETTWTDVAKDISKLTEDKTQTIDLNGSTTVPVEVVKAIATSNAEVTLKVDDVFSWTIDGSDIDAKDAKAANLSITKATVTGTSALRGTVGTGFTIKGTNVKSELNINFKATNAGKFANLFKKVDGKLVFVDNVKVDKNGAAIGLEVSEKGEYVVMLGKYSDRAGDMDNDGIMNTKDSLAILKDFLDIESGENPVVADINGDGYINAKDALEVLIAFLNLK